MSRNDLVLTRSDDPRPSCRDSLPAPPETPPVEHAEALAICRATVAWLRESVRNGATDRAVKRAAEDRRRGVR